MAIARCMFVVAVALALALAVAVTVSLASPTTTATGVGHLLVERSLRAAATCSKFPRMCHAKGSPGPDCCSRRCVDVRTDSLNCGRCGRRCRYGWTCCRGRCVNIMYDAKNCGACRRRCPNGSFCRYTPSASCSCGNHKQAGRFGFSILNVS
nr:PREDICTED: stigma-specific STIG1-like protein 1 [Musa acuminata subsp. malaccensis]